MCRQGRFSSILLLFFNIVQIKQLLAEPVQNYRHLLFGHVRSGAVRLPTLGVIFTPDRDTDPSSMPFTRAANDMIPAVFPPMTLATGATGTVRRGNFPG
jgi:hypothetical protein